MRCPFCHCEETKVIDSRLALDGDAIRRRRECLKCQERFTTFETAELGMPRLVKRDGRRVAFNEDSLTSGILRSLEKRPVPSADVEDMIARIVHKLHSCGEREVATSYLGDIVMDELKKLDEVAYVRFASVYRSFQDVNEFKHEIDKLK